MKNEKILTKVSCSWKKKKHYSLQTWKYAKRDENSGVVLQVGKSGLTQREGKIAY